VRITGCQLMTSWALCTRPNSGAITREH